MLHTNGLKSRRAVIVSVAVAPELKGGLESTSRSLSAVSLYKHHRQPSVRDSPGVGEFDFASTVYCPSSI